MTRVIKVRTTQQCNIYSLKKCWWLSFFRIYKHSRQNEAVREISSTNSPFRWQLSKKWESSLNTWNRNGLRESLMLHLQPHSLYQRQFSNHLPICYCFARASTGRSAAISEPLLWQAIATQRFPQRTCGSLGFSSKL